MGNDVHIWELAWVFDKRPKYVGNDVDLSGKSSNMWGNDLIIWQTASKCGKWLRDFWNGQNNWKMA